VPLLVGLRERKTVRASGNVPELGTDLIRRLSLSYARKSIRVKIVLEFQAS